MNATVKTGKKHFPVMLNELISIISPLYSGTFVDCTFGQGEYSKAILKHSGNKVIAIDRDKKTLFKNYKNKVIKPDLKELQENNPSRSAKLRHAIRSNHDFTYPEEFKKKFLHYLELEKIDV